MLCMTFNLRFENDRDGENAWVYRRDLVVNVINRYKPALLGTQEGTQGQLLYLQDRLPQYHMHVPFRTWDETCQYPTLYFLPQLFSLKEGEEFWLSSTPSIHRSKDWDSAFPRMMSCALLEDLSNGRSLWVAVTHLDHMSAKARLEQGRMIARWVRGKGGAAIVMGDFNDAPCSSVHCALIGRQTGLKDTWMELGRQENDKSMTHHDFHGIPEKCRMDWILVTRDFEVLDAMIVRDNEKGRFPSDHFPYAARLQWVPERMLSSDE